jgi:uncharacterized protein (TIGR02246 family)
MFFPLLGLMLVLHAGPQTAREAAIRDVVEKYVDARDRSDEAAIRALFTADADQLTSSGEWRRGRDELVKGTLASSKSNPGTRTIAIETVRSPSAGVAIADGRYEIAGAPGAAPRRMWTSFVIVESGARGGSRPFATCCRHRGGDHADDPTLLSGS